MLDNSNLGYYLFLVYYLSLSIWQHSNDITLALLEQSVIAVRINDAVH